jgi:uncharacterized protein YkwD
MGRSLLTSITLIWIWFCLACGTVKENSPPNASSTTTTVSNAVSQIFNATNGQRRQRRVEPLTKDDRLMTAAQDYALLMAKKDELTHNVSGQSLESRIERVQYRWAAIGENIAVNTSLKGEDIVLEQWMKSAGHRSNLLSKDFRQIGIGIAGPSKTNKYYYCQIFARAK